LTQTDAKINIGLRLIQLDSFYNCHKLFFTKKVFISDPYIGHIMATRRHIG